MLLRKSSILKFLIKPIKLPLSSIEYSVEVTIERKRITKTPINFQFLSIAFHFSAWICELDVMSGFLFLYVTYLRS